MFSYKSLASGALILGIIGIADNKPMDLCYRCYIYSFFITYFQMRIILKGIEIQIENNTFTFKQDNLTNVPIKYKFSKPIFIQFNLTYTGLENSTRPLVFTSASGCRASENFDISSIN